MPFVLSDNKAWGSSWWVVTILPHSALCPYSYYSAWYTVGMKVFDV